LWLFDFRKVIVLDFKHTRTRLVIIIDFNPESSGNEIEIKKQTELVDL